MSEGESIVVDKIVTSNEFSKRVRSALTRLRPVAKVSLTAADLLISYFNVVPS